MGIHRRRGPPSRIGLPRWLVPAGIAVILGLILPLAAMGQSPSVAAPAGEAPDRISVVYCADCVPFHFSDESGNPAGMIIDDWKLWSEKTGIAIDFRAAPWDETLNLMRDRKVHAHAGLFYSEERDRFLEYGSPLRETETHFFVHKSLIGIEQIEDLAAYRVGVLSGDFVESFLEAKLPEGTVVGFESYDIIMGALRGGGLKVIAADTPTALYHLKQAGLDDQFVYLAESPLYRMKWFVAATEGDRDLIEIINAGMTRITSEERRGIGQRWTSEGGQKTAETLVVAIDQNYLPFSLIGPDGRPSGLLVDTWNLWSETTGIPVRFRASNWTGTLEALRTGDADIHFGLFKNLQREKWIAFSRPIHEIKTAVYYRGDRAPPPRLSDIQGIEVGAISGSYQETFLKEQYKNLNVRGFPNGTALVIALLRGEIDALVNEVPYVDADLNRYGLRGDLVRGTEVLLTNQVHAGVIKSNKALLEQIDRGLAAIPDAQLAAIDERWLPNTEDRFHHRTEEVELTPEEREWLERNPVWKVASEMDWPPFDFVEDGRAQGFSIDVAKSAAAKLGVKLEFVNGFTFAELTEQFKAGQLDILPAIFETEDRRHYIAYTEAYSSNPSVLVVHSNRTDIQTVEDLTGRKVAVISAYATAQIIEKRHPEIERIYVKNPEEALNAVSIGHVDAFIGSIGVISYLTEKKFIPNIQIVGDSGIKKREETRLHMGVAKNRPVFRKVLQKGMDAITDEEMRRIRRRWTPSLTRSSGAPVVDLTRAERRWLARHTELRLGVDPASPPFEFFSELGEYSGIGSGYVDAVAERLGVAMTPIPNLSWPQVVELAKRGEIDVLPMMMRSREREQYLNFTKPYVSFPVVIAAHRDAPFIGDLGDLAGRKVGIPQDYVTGELIRRDYPEIDLVPFPTLADGLRAVDDRSIEAFVDNLGTITYGMASDNLLNIKIAAPTEYTLDLSMAVRKDWPELIGILDKSLDTIASKERAAIRNTWMALDVRFGLDIKTIFLWSFPIGGVAFFIIAFVVVWNRRLDTEVNVRKRAEEALEEKDRQLRTALDSMIDGMFILDSDFRYVLFNEPYKQIISLPEGTVRIGQPIEPVVRAFAERGDYGPGDVNEMVAARMKTLGADSPSHIELNTIGGTRYIELRSAPMPGGGVVSVARDITKRRLAEEELHKSEERYRRLVAGSLQGILVHRDYKPLFANQALADIFGYKDADEILDLSSTRVLSSPKDHERIDQYRMGRLRGENVPSRYEWDGVRKDGSPVLLESLVTMVDWDGEVAFQIAMFDITERKRAAKVLEEAHEITRKQKERMEEELNIGREIQLNMIPLTFPPFPDHSEFSIFAVLDPAREVGGDFYDFFFVDEDRLCICIGDVSGKGVPAALFMAVTKTLIKSRAADDPSTASIMTHINGELSSDNKTSMFVTVFLCIVNIMTGKLLYTNAGHNPPYLKRADGSVQRLDSIHGPVAGAMDGFVYTEESEDFGSDDLLLMYTDGVTEQRNHKSVMFAEPRLAKLLKSKAIDSAESIVRVTVNAMRIFQGSGEQVDDVTLLGFQYFGNATHVSTGSMRIAIKNRMAEIQMAHEKCGEFIEANAIPDRVGRKMRLIIDELLSNVISHAFRDDNEHDIDIHVELSGNRLTTTIVDDGVPFNPLRSVSPDTDLPLEERDIGGLGVHLVRNMADDIFYRRRIARNVLTYVIFVDRDGQLT